MIIRRFKMSDIDKLDIQDEQEHELENSAFMKTEHCFTFVKDDQIVGIFGVFEVYKGRAIVFSFISKSAGKCLFSVLGAVLGTPLSPLRVVPTLRRKLSD